MLDYKIQVQIRHEKADLYIPIFVSEHRVQLERLPYKILEEDVASEAAYADSTLYSDLKPKVGMIGLEPQQLRLDPEDENRDAFQSWFDGLDLKKGITSIPLSSKSERYEYDQAGIFIKRQLSDQRIEVVDAINFFLREVWRENKAMIKQPNSGSSHAKMKVAFHLFDDELVAAILDRHLVDIVIDDVGRNDEPTDASVLVMGHPTEVAVSAHPNSDYRFLSNDLGKGKIQSTLKELIEAYVITHWMPASEINWAEFWSQSKTYLDKLVTG